MRLVLIAPVLIAPLLVGGCDIEAPEPAPLAQAPPEVEESGFSDSTALLEHIKTLKTADDYLAMLDLVKARTRVESATLTVHRRIALAKLDYHRAITALNAADQEAEDIPPIDLGMGSLHQLIRDATIERQEGRKAYAPFQTVEGEEHAIVLLTWQGSWWVSPDTIAGGQAVTDVWFGPKQSRFVGIARAYERVAAQIADGEITEVAAAEEALAAALSGRMPNVGALYIQGSLPTVKD